jgi:Uncharacterized conserved protein (DUF2190)
MTQEIPGQKFTLPASADLSASQYCLLVANSSGQAVVQTAATDVIGVLCNKPTAAGRACEIQADNIAKVRSGASLTAGTRVMSDGSGRAITCTSTNKCVGIAIEASGAANQVIKVLLKDLGTF